jgi:cytochrome c biogenesis protein CcdA
VLKRISRWREARAARACAMPDPERVRKRGVIWIAGAFLICPCHLPLTLWLLALALSGTAVASLLEQHPYIAGAIIALVWAAATWHGVRLLRAAQGTVDSARRATPTPVA